MKPESWLSPKFLKVYSRFLLHIPVLGIWIDTSLVKIDDHVRCSWTGKNGTYERNLNLLFFIRSFGDGVNFPIRTVDEDYDSLLGQRQRWMEEGDDGSGPGKC